MKKRKQNKSKIVTTTEFQKLLLKALTWSDQEYTDFLKGKKHFNQFRSL